MRSACNGATKAIGCCFRSRLLGLLWFRRGTTVAWVVMLFVAMQALPAKAQEQPHRFADLWLTPDQQGRIAFDRGDYTTAAQRFADPMWRGIAAYRALDFLTAAQAVPQGRDRGGPLRARQCRGAEPCLGKVDQGVRRGAEGAARPSRGENQSRDRGRAFEAQEEKRRKQEQDDSAPPDQKADEMRVDPKQKGGKRIQVTPQDVTTAGAAEAWMRAVQTTPADFLKLKFAIQARQTRRAQEGGDEALARLGNPCCRRHRAVRRLGAASSGA